MNRGKPLQRRTPLTSKTPLQTRTPLSSSKPLVRSFGINPVSRKRQRENAQRVVVVSAMRAACQGRCARCGRRDMPVHGHERLGRAQGGDIINPDCLLDPICNEWCESNPRIAAWTGWKISSKWPHSPDLEPWQAWDLDGNIVDFTVAAADLAGEVA